MIRYFTDRMSGADRMSKVYSWTLAFLIGVLFLSSACTPEKKPPPERTEPWQRDDAAGRANKASTTTKYLVASGTSLELSVPARRNVPRGTVHGISGQLLLDAEQLQFVQGTIEIDLLQIKMDDQLALPANDQTRKVITPAIEKRLTEQSWSIQAHNWLGLGIEVPARKRLALATFNIESAKELSHPRASLGSAGTDTSHGKSRQSRLVNATVLGKLTLRSISVSRYLRVQIKFIYDGIPFEMVPSEIVIQLREPFSVPLAEYEIKARDRAGHPISELDEIIGYWVGNTALVQGSITLTKAPLD